MPSDGYWKSSSIHWSLYPADLLITAAHCELWLLPLVARLVMWKPCVVGSAYELRPAEVPQHFLVPADLLPFLLDPLKGEDVGHFVALLREACAFAHDDEA